MRKKRLILSVTGTRADYGIYTPVYRAITRSRKLDLLLAVTGMHLSAAYGHTVDIVRREGFPIAGTVDILQRVNTKASMAESVALGIQGFTKMFSEVKPDFVMLLGDRGEMLAGAIAAAYLTIPIVHLHGGESSGSVDDVVRHAITHMAAIHCASTTQHAERIIRMIGHARHVHAVGAPALDTIVSMKKTPKKTLLHSVGLDEKKPLILFVQHPDTTDSKPEQHQVQASLDALADCDANILLLGANADAGGVLFNACMRAFIKTRPNTRYMINVPHGDYLSWLAAADVMVGNSSSGIIEAASFKTPVVNVGDRQRGRARSGNVIDVPLESKAIRKGIDKAMKDQVFRKKLAACVNIYGDGKASGRIVSTLESYTG